MPLPAVPRRASLAIVMASLVLVITGCEAPPPPPAASDPLLALNARARENYAASRALLLERQRPAIFVEFDELVLLRTGRPQLKANYTPPLYHRYKQVAHLPLGIWATLAPWVDRPQSRDWQAPLQALLEHAEAARSGLAVAGFPDDRLDRQRRILDESIAFMRTTLTLGAVSAVELRAYARSLAGPVLANGDDAAALQIDGLHALVGSWRRDLISAEEWQRIFVVILGPRMPREDNLAQQYFERVMGRVERGRRLIYAEGIFRHDDAAGLLGTIVTDRRLANDFFGQDMRMDRDFLADGATRRLDAIFGRQRR
jgi:hypothetical protein